MSSRSLVSFALALLHVSISQPCVAGGGPAAIVVAGAPGETDYETNFLGQLTLWESACQQGGVHCTIIGRGAGSSAGDHQCLKSSLESVAKDGLDPLWLVLIGHGTFDGKEARFNLRGPDVSASELAEWLKPFRRPLVIIDTTSASAPFLKALAGTNRVVISSTRSGHEVNFARFGQYLARALPDPESDLDRDGQISVLEAFLVASRDVAEFYQTEGRLATEHALIEDNGDGLATPSGWFRGVRAIKRSADGAAVDGARAHQFHLVPNREEAVLTPEIRSQRDTLELEVIRLRDSKASHAEEEYYRKLETLLLELARLQLGQMERSPSSELRTPNVELPTPNVELPTPNVELPTPNVELPTPKAEP